MTIALCTETSTAMERPRRRSSSGRSSRSSSRKSGSNNKKSNKGGDSAPSSGRRLSNNKWFNLIINVFNELAGGVDLQDKIVDCLPESWRPKVSNDDNDKGDNNAIKSAGQSSSTLKKVLDIVSKVINFVCKFKGVVAKLLGKKMRRFYKRQQMRMNFVEYRSHNRSMKNFKYYRRWFGKKFLQKVKNTVKNVARKVVSGVKKAGSFVANVAKKGLEAVKNIALKIVKELKDIFNTFVAKIKQIINNPILQRIIKIIKCAKEFFGHAKTIVSVIKGIISRVKTVVSAIASQTYVGIIPVLIDLICNFDHFRAAIEYLVAAVREKNTLQKFIGFGKFFGKLLYALGSGAPEEKKGGKKGGNSAPKKSSRSSGKSSSRRRGRRGYY